MKIDCICGENLNHGLVSFNDFEGLRNNCDALREILIPDVQWEAFRNFCIQQESQPDRSNHQSPFWLAFRDGRLSYLTLPIHRFAFDSRFSTEYKNNLVERWYSEPCRMERHRKSREYFGKIIELQFALVLEQKGWKIQNLNAYKNGRPDVQAEKAGINASFEVKYFGIEDDDFERELFGSAGTVSPYAAANFLIFKEYDAAKQLKRENLHSDNKKIAVCVISESTYWRFEVPLRDGWSRSVFEFYPADKKWGDFLAKRKSKKSTKYNNIEEDLRHGILKTLDDIWFLRYKDYQIHDPLKSILRL